MWRVIFIFLAMLMVGNATGLIPEADEIGCTDDDEGKQCPPTCATCTCVAHSLKTAAVAPVELTVLLIARTVELPPLRAVHGRLAPLLVHRPPIV